MFRPSDRSKLTTLSISRTERCLRVSCRSNQTGLRIKICEQISFRVVLLVARRSPMRTRENVIRASLRDRFGDLISSLVTYENTKHTEVYRVQLRALSLSISLPRFTRARVLRVRAHVGCTRKSRFFLCGGATTTRIRGVHIAMADQSKKNRLFNFAQRIAR